MSALVGGFCDPEFPFDAGLGCRLCHLVADGHLSAGGDGQDTGTSSREEGPVRTGGEGGSQYGFHGVEYPLAGRLMESVPRCDGEVGGVASGEGPDEQGDPTQVVDGVFPRDVLGKEGSGFLGRHRYARNEYDTGPFGWHWDGCGDRLTILFNDYLESATKGGCHVVGMAFGAHGKFQYLVGGQGFGAHRASGQQSGGYCGATTAKASLEGNCVVAGHADGRYGFASLDKRQPEGGVDEVGSVGRKLALALTTHGDAIGPLDNLHSVPDIKRHRKAVESGAEVGGGGRRLDGDAIDHLRGIHRSKVFLGALNRGS